MNLWKSIWRTIRELLSGNKPETKPATLPPIIGQTDPKPETAAMEDQES